MLVFNETIFKNIQLYLCNTLGVSIRNEITPLLPDTVYTDVGKSE